MKRNAYDISRSDQVESRPPSTTRVEFISFVVINIPRVNMLHIQVPSDYTVDGIKDSKRSGNMKMLPLDAVISASRSSMSASAMKHQPQHSMHRCFCPSNGRPGRWTGQIGHTASKDDWSCQNRKKQFSLLHAVRICTRLRAEIFLSAFAQLLHMSAPQAWAFMKLPVIMDNALSHVVACVLSRHTEISFHAEGVPDPLYGPWFSETGNPDDEASATVDALRDMPVLHQEQFREIESFLNVRFNNINNRPTDFSDILVQTSHDRCDRNHSFRFCCCFCGCKPQLDESCHCFSLQPGDD